MPQHDDEHEPDNPRWWLARRVADVLRHRHSADLIAIGLHGSMAHGDDADASDVNLLVVTYRRGAGPRPVQRRVDGTMVDLTVVSADDHLRQARTLTSAWPLQADSFVTTRGLHDPQEWLKALRDTHLGRLAEARPAEFTTLAREAWCRAAAAHERAVRLASWYDTDAALLLLGQARLHAAVVVGLLSRTYFRNAADAVKRAGTAGVDMAELGSVLKQQAEELAARGRPVDGPLNSLWD
ncbi:nucleotidyltransferase domain-containing protein [Spirilliplanes yamanashiensis]|uniref:Nucleotidyltransferase domain-containing protein n=1 Tax=Spirilliplanes yamanashiensis TaxID=42233 RepID=A0A8J4DHZ5_9ACTN|nr:nucleotidyltransferase domain-containing protein [Spirilliplanes yamanashiensis]MDP9819650.1 hypothetical protein [Spirilliplanes yamanashiensis]GIJ01530.1 hypothetical protein Sya03_08820 [Spirilliplanes yamanashiensis]